MAVLSRHRLICRSLPSRLAFLLGFAISASCARAERIEFDSKVTLEGGVLANSVEGRRVNESLLIVEPSATFRAEGARIRVSGTASVKGYRFSQSAQSSFIEPTIDVAGSIEPVDNMLFLDARARLVQFTGDPFGENSLLSTGRNTSTATILTASPMFRSRLGPSTQFVAKSDLTTTRNNADVATASNGTGTFLRNNVSVTHDEGELRFGADIESTRTKYKGNDVGALVTENAQVSVSDQILPQLLLGIRGGRQRDNFSDDPHTRDSVGAFVRWNPTERTDFTASRDTAYVGSAWALGLRHRMPVFAVNLTLGRDVLTTPRALIELPVTQNVQGLLDDIFTTRYPDPVERARVVREYMSQQGLPNAILVPTPLVSRRLSVVTSRGVGMVVTGVTNVLAMNLYKVDTHDALDTGPFGDGLTVGNNVRSGVAVNLTHRFTPATSGTLAIENSRIKAFGGFDVPQTRQEAIRISINSALSPRTTVVAKGSFRRLISTAVDEGKQAAVSAALVHEF